VLFCSLGERIDRQQNNCCHPQDTLRHVVKQKQFHAKCNTVQGAPFPAQGFYCSSRVDCFRTDLYQHSEVWWVGTEGKKAEGSSSEMLVCLSTNLYGATYQKFLMLATTELLHP
jgi:hypothetical protein